MRAEDRLEDHLSPQSHWFLYSLVTPCSDLTKLNINLPDLLKVALTDTKRSLPDHIQKKMFIQGEDQIRLTVRVLNFLFPIIGGIMRLLCP